MLTLSLSKMVVETKRACYYLRAGYHPPPGFYAAKIAEALFEAVPQSFLQTYVTVTDVYDNKPIDSTLLTSISVSFVNVGAAVAGLGPEFALCFGRMK